MTSKLPERDPERSVPDQTHPQNDARRSRRIVWLAIISALAPWPRLGWGVSLSLILAGDLVTATIAWFAVGMVMR
jgi:hypothetical protein